MDYVTVTLLSYFIIQTLLYHTILVVHIQLFKHSSSSMIPFTTTSKYGLNSHLYTQCQTLPEVPGQIFIYIFLRFYIQTGCINNWVPFICDSFQTFCLTTIVIDVP